MHPEMCTVCTDDHSEQTLVQKHFWDWPVLLFPITAWHNRYTRRWW